MTRAYIHYRRSIKNLNKNIQISLNNFCNLLEQSIKNLNKKRLPCCKQNESKLFNGYKTQCIKSKLIERKRRIKLKKLNHGGFCKSIRSSDSDSSENPPPFPGFRKNSSKVTQLPVQLCPLMILIFTCSGNLSLYRSSSFLLAFKIE